jgi:hypothetical protein
VFRIDPVASHKIAPYLTADETLHWAGMPNPNVIFHSDDWTVIPFSLLWAGFIFFWEFDAWKQRTTFMILWGIPFLLFGNYMVWGRFLADAWLKRRTYYAVTNRRVLVFQEAWSAKYCMMYLDHIPTIEWEGSTTGTLWFGPKLPILGARGQKKRDMSRFLIGDTPVFADIDEVESVHKLILDLRARLSPRPSQKEPLTYSTP